MARPNLETAAAPALQGSLENHIQAGAALLMLTTAAAASVYPGVLLGAAVAGLWRSLDRPPPVLRIAVAVVLTGVFVALRPVLQTGWLWRLMLNQSQPVYFPQVDGALIVRSLPVEVLLGPIALELFLLAFALTRRTLGGQIRRDHRRHKAQWRAVGGRRGGKLRMQLNRQPDENFLDHPSGFVRLGLDRETNQPLDLQLPDELATHVFIPGTTGSGKTTTLLRLADGAIANWYGTIIIDCKAGDLGDAAYRLAARYDLPFHIVDADDPQTLGYDICAGDGASVANKLVGAFAFGPNAEIYKNIAMEAIPLAVDGLIAAGERVTLERLYDAFGPRGFAVIAQKITETANTKRLRKRLLDVASRSSDRLTQNGISGIQRRLGALMEGKFGPLFRLPQTLDWQKALAEPSVVYVALPVLASPEDVELMGRVIAQDLKQLCAQRLRALRRGEELVPVLAIFDEFTALREADQLVDLLVQARQALMPTVISTQYIPQTVPLQKATLSAGLIICHRVEGHDAEDIANQFGTHKTTEITHQIDFQTGFAEKGTSKRVDAYNLSPNILRTLQRGYVATKSTARGRHAIVHVFKNGE